MMAPMEDLCPNLVSLSQEVAIGLQRSGHQLVLAESCTAGLVAASLGAVPGISKHFCGSAVVYQERTKTAWIDVSATQLADTGAVTAEIAAAMAAGVLARTSFADLAVAVTGHLGPTAPAELNGMIYVAVQRRGTSANVHQHRLASPTGQQVDDLRVRRQTEAAAIVLCAVRDFLLKPSPADDHVS